MESLIDIDVQRVQEIIGYTSGSNVNLMLALTAAHRNDLEVGGVESTDGNKRLAAVGDSILKLILVEDWYHTGENSTRLQDICIRSYSNFALCTVATQSGISSCVTLSPRQQGNEIPPATLYTAIKAIIGACWLDSERDQTVVRRVLHRLGIIQSQE